VITLGNHAYRHREAYEYLDTTERVVRPANFMAGSPGHGHVIVEVEGTRLCVINLIGQVQLRTGKVFAAEADALLERADGMLAKFRSHESAPTALSLAICNGEMGTYLAPRICDFIAGNKHVELNVQILSSRQALEHLQAGDIDVCIGRFPALPETLGQEFVVESGLTLACAPGHPLLKKKRIGLEDIAEHTLFTLARHSLTRDNIDRTFAAADVQVKSCIDAGNCSTAREFAARGVGVAIIHSLCALPEAKGRLKFVDLGATFGRLAFFAVYRKKNVSPAILALIEELTRPSSRAA